MLKVGKYEVDVRARCSSCRGDVVLDDAMFEQDEEDLFFTAQASCACGSDPVRVHLIVALGVVKFSIEAEQPEHLKRRFRVIDGGLRPVKDET